MYKPHLTTSLIAVCALVACAEAPDDGARLAIKVAPFEIEAVTNASYQLTVRNDLDEVVWTRLVDAAGYGRGGSLSYVGPCDAQSNPNTVTVEILELFNGATPVDPAIYNTPGPITRSVTCEPNQDTSVEFDITILIDPPNTTQFVNIGVSFANIFCSAKLDCRDEQGDPLLLLHDSTGARAQTAVVALSCTAGAGADTVLYRENLEIVCDDGAGTVLTTVVDPAAGPGNLALGAGISGDAGVLFGAAVSVGDEQLGYSKAYWNVLLGLAPGAKGCTLTTSGTAHDGAFANDTVPVGTVWPYIDWTVDLTDTAGNLVCTRHPVGGVFPNDGVSALYTDGSAVTWSHIYFREAPPYISGTLLPADPGHWQDGVARSCEEYRHPVDGHLYAGVTGDGIYTVDPDGTGPIAAFDAYCDMTTDGGGWTLVSRHFGAVGMQDTAAVGTLSGPTQTSGAKLSDAVINALRPDYDTAVFRFSCSAGAPSYFQQSLAFQATGAGTDALLRCSNAWDAASWYLATQYVSHFGLNNYLQDGNCGVYQIWDYGGSGCYPDGVGTTYVKGPIVGVTPLTGGRVIGDPARWGDGTYAASCNDYLNPGAGYVYFGAIGDGVYAIDPDGDGTPFEAYCDMTADSGGWTLLATLQSTDSGGTANWPSWAAEWWTIPHGSPPDPTVAFSNQDTRLFRPLISPTSIVRASSPAAAVSRYHFNMTQADWDLWDTTRTVAAVRLIGPFGSPTSTLVSTSASLSGAVTAGLNGHWDSGYFYLGTATNGGDTDGEDLGARYHVSTNAPGSFGYVGDVRQSALWHLWLK